MFLPYPGDDSAANAPKVPSHRRGFHFSVSDVVRLTSRSRLNNRPCIAAYAAPLGAICAYFKQEISSAYLSAFMPRILIACRVFPVYFTILC